ncbi:MAG: C-terminal helicase domain-containing protein, partial [Bacteroidota bacterium]
HWAYDQLSHQGRMHADIMAFPAEQFYDGSLHILPKSTGFHLRQLAPLICQPGTSVLEQQLSSKRLVFFPTTIDRQSTDRKTNRHEAKLVNTLITAFEGIYSATDAPIKSGEIGIITPYRAQIAKIRRTLVQAGRNPQEYTVDTVERYQGGARRIIILSLCTNEANQMKSLAQTNSEAIDRKLNVAMTRAREHLVILGCEEILRTVPHYAGLLDFIDAVQVG